MTCYALYADQSLAYPSKDELFRPDQAYPEYLFGSSAIGHGRNKVYDGVRGLFQLAGLDSASFGSAAWNPLGEYVHPGDCVLVKPNLVMHKNAGSSGTDCLYTHPSVIAAVIDYVVIALGGRGSIILADAPMQSCDWDMLVEESGVRQLCSWYRDHGVDITLVDLRGLRSVATATGLKQELVDRADGKVIDLGDSSSFADLSPERIESLRITNYDPDELKRHHSSTKHEYYIASALLNADVIVNLPKAKTHRKAGITGALKNMIGVNVRKEYLPHHSNGAKEDGFDEYLKSSRLKTLSDSVLDDKNRRLTDGSSIARKPLGLLARELRSFGSHLSHDDYSEGSWYGNDTIWRTVADLNKIVFHADRDGVMQDSIQRRMITVCDMVTIGQGEGPLLPEPGDWKMLALSDNPTTHDVGMARMLGTDESMIPVIHHALAYRGRYSWGDPEALGCICRSNSPEFDGIRLSDLNSSGRYLARPSSGWRGHFAFKG